MTAIRALVILLFLVALAAAAGLVLVRKPAIEPVEPPQRSSFDPAVIARGARLSALGNCQSCHTAERGKPFAGGRPMHTPFGVLHTTNITPDPDSGIGRWSEAAFTRAMREGVDREGRHLYPAFPYEYFARLTDDDIRALYAFVMTREPVRAENKPHELPFPFNIRAANAAWKFAFMEFAPFVRDSSKSDDWNHGAYLVGALAHCSACHTPRNIAGAEKKRQLFDGGEVEGWHAPALNASSPSPAPWTMEELYTYLRTGLVDRHAIAAGPMAPVVSSLAQAPEREVRSIAAFIGESLSQAPGRQSAAAGSSRPAGNGGSLYTAACGACHDQGRTHSSGGALPLELAIAVTEPTSKNLLRITLEGIPAPEGAPGRAMPGFAAALTDEQVKDLLAHIRQRFAGLEPWRDVDEELRKIREGKK